MNQLSPGLHNGGFRVFSACLLAFLMLSAPLAPLATSSANAEQSTRTTKAAKQPRAAHAAREAGVGTVR